jgi:hypothetical protein
VYDPKHPPTPGELEENELRLQTEIAPGIIFCLLAEGVNRLATARSSLLPTTDATAVASRRCAARISSPCLLSQVDAEGGQRQVGDGDTGGKIFEIDKRCLGA